jgi:PKD repeat protein
MLCSAVGVLVCAGLGFASSTPSQAAVHAPIGMVQGRVPIPDPGGPYAATIGHSIRLEAKSSAASESEGVVFAWDFGDGHSATGPSPTHTYTAEGSYIVTLLASDDKGGVATAMTRVVVTNFVDGNRPPVAVDNGPFVGVINQPLVIDGSGSRDPEDDMLAYTWTFGDGASDSGATVTHTYAHPGTYHVKMLVTDTKGGATARTILARIESASEQPNRPPVATGHAPDEAWGGAPVTFSGSESSDPDGDPLTFSWAFDDGESATGAVVTHAFIETGKHTAKLTVTDGRGGEDSTVVELRIDRTEGNLYPTVEIGGPYSGVSWTPVAFDASASKDRDGDEITFAWDFGDGTKASGPTPSHTYTKAGTFRVTLVVADDNGDAVKVSTTVDIGLAPESRAIRLVASAGGPYTGGIGKAVSFKGSGSTNSDANTIRYAWAFGDGATAIGPSPLHEYAAPGTYSVLLLVSDGSGGSAAAVSTSTIR